MQGPVESFRLAFLPVFLLMLALGLLANGVWLLIFFVLKIKTAGLLVGLGGVTVVVVLLAFLAVVFFPTGVGSWGVRGYDAWGLYHNVAWADVEAARPARLLGLRFLRVFPRGGRPVWVPLFLSDMTRFRGLVAQHAGPGHPLTAALQTAAKPVKR
jgi:hypothetical protein